MQRVFSLLLLSITTTLAAISPKEARESPDQPRIMYLLPDLVSPIGIEPAVPSYFVAMSPNGQFDASDWIYWGPEDVLTTYFRNPSELRSPVLRIKLSTNMIQTEPSRFSEESMQCIQKMKRQDPQSFEYRELTWGLYPVIAVKARIGKKTALMAWVGANDPETGSTLMFNLVYPEQNSSPSAQETNFWNQFINNTKQLVDQDLFKALGQDLQPGYTIVKTGGAKLKMTAEKRQRDGKIQVVVVPMQPGVTFEGSEIEECSLGSNWKKGAPMVKVYGRTTAKKGRSCIVTDHVTSILLETVQDFSVDADDEDLKGASVYQTTEEDRCDICT